MKCFEIKKKYKILASAEVPEKQNLFPIHNHAKNERILI